MQNILPELTRMLESGENLPTEQVSHLADLLASAKIPTGDKAALLRCLAAKGETPHEVAAFASAFRKLATDPEVSDLAADAIDIVGTGGDRSGTYNFSTTTALALAASGVRVMKHGNRSITSKSGSADFLAALGVTMDAPTPHFRESLQRFNFCFFFAPRFHPAFKEIMPVRKALAEQGIRTVFNLLGPLINPGRPAYQVTGVFSPTWVGAVADALSTLGLQRGLVIHCRASDQQGIDELTTAGENLLQSCGVNPAPLPVMPTLSSLGLHHTSLALIRGGDAEDNLSTFRAILENRAPEPVTESLLLNIAAGLLVMERVNSWEEGVEAGRRLITSGDFANWVSRFSKFLKS